MESLAPFVGEWEMAVDMPHAPAPDAGVSARCAFEWLPGEKFLVQRWEVSIPEAPDGIALIGWDEGRGTLLQHYFDSRGVARVYEMTFDGRVWTLLREQADFAPLDFAQRYEPHGYNVGFNQGRVAGAGVEHHIHMHVVPRWGGDTNFMPVLGDTRVMAQTLQQTYETLTGGFR